MKIQHLSFFAAGLLALLAGCTTFDSRIKENQAAFDRLSAADQQTIRSGYIKVGYTPEMVYMALDKPERKIEGSAPGEQTWVYHNFYSQSGSSLTQPQKLKTNVATQPRNNTFSVEPDLAAENVKADAMIKVHVKFAEGKVSTIEVIRPH